MSLTRTRLRVAVRVMRYYNSVPLLGAVQTTSLLLVMIQNEASSLSALPPLKANAAFAPSRALRAASSLAVLIVSRKPLAGRVVQKRLLPMRKNKTPTVIVGMRSDNSKLQNRGSPFKNEVAGTV